MIEKTKTTPEPNVGAVDIACVEPLSAGGILSPSGSVVRMYEQYANIGYWWCQGIA